MCFTPCTFLVHFQLLSVAMTTRTVFQQQKNRDFITRMKGHMKYLDNKKVVIIDYNNVLTSKGQLALLQFFNWLKVNPDWFGILLLDPGCYSFIRVAAVQCAYSELRNNNRIFHLHMRPTAVKSTTDQFAGLAVDAILTNAPGVSEIHLVSKDKCILITAQLFSAILDDGKRVNYRQTMDAFYADNAAAPVTMKNDKFKDELDQLDNIVSNNILVIYISGGLSKEAVNVALDKLREQESFWHVIFLLASKDTTSLRTHVTENYERVAFTAIGHAKVKYAFPLVVQRLHRVLQPDKYQIRRAIYAVKGDEKEIFVAVQEIWKRVLDAEMIHVMLLPSSDAFAALPLQNGLSPRENHLIPSLANGEYTNDYKFAVMAFVSNDENINTYWSDLLLAGFDLVSVTTCFPITMLVGPKSNPELFHNNTRFKVYSKQVPTDSVMQKLLLKLPESIKNSPTATWSRKETTVGSKNRLFANRGARNITDGMLFDIIKYNSATYYVRKRVVGSRSGGVVIRTREELLADPKLILVLRHYYTYYCLE